MTALSGMKAICRHIGKSETTMIILIRDYGFPATKIMGCWESDTELIDAWRKQQVIKRLSREASAGEKNEHPG